jgi:hypothetical protein
MASRCTGCGRRDRSTHGERQRRTIGTVFNETSFCVDKTYDAAYFQRW